MITLFFETSEINNSDTQGNNPENLKPSHHLYKNLKYLIDIFMQTYVSVYLAQDKLPPSAQYRRKL